MSSGISSITSSVKEKIEDIGDRRAIERYYAEKAREATSQLRSKKYEQEMQKRLSRSSSVQSTPTTSPTVSESSQVGGYHEYDDEESDDDSYQMGGYNQDGGNCYGENDNWLYRLDNLIEIFEKKEKRVRQQE